MNPPSTADRRRIEGLAVAALTVVGAVLRLCPPGRLGLTHFDEGVYALAASWSLDPRGLASLDPTLIPYAPPGFPILAGLAYAFFGASDGSILLVSWVAGTLTIPAVAWLAGRTFGPGAGLASAAVAAISGPHLAYSRMALTDASFLLAWLVAIGQGMRFLERPGLARGVALGLGVGIAQQFKYNGWLAGAIVAATAGLGILAVPEDRRPAAWLRSLGWGLVSVGVAWLVVWPWYAFVEGHGGYADLLRHQRSYLGGIGSWWPNLRAQAEQAVAFSTGLGLAWLGIGLIALTYPIARPPAWVAESEERSPTRLVLGVLGVAILARLFDAVPPWLGLVAAPWLLASARPARRILGAWWLALAILSPFYHPYSRLWLPLEAANWILIGGMVAEGRGWIPQTRPAGRLRAGYLAASLAAGGAFFLLTIREARPQPDLLGPSDSTRFAAGRVASLLPDGLAGLLVLVRPPVRYYLAGRVPMAPLPGSEPLLRPGPPRAWALVDSTILRSESGAPVPGLPDRFARHWELVEEIPSTLALPTLLDVDPGAARGISASRDAPLWLLRPRPSRPPP